MSYNGDFCTEKNQKEIMIIFITIKRFERERETEKDICNNHSLLVWGVFFVKKEKCFPFPKIRKEKHFHGTKV